FEVGSSPWARHFSTGEHVMKAAAQTGSTKQSGNWQHETTVLHGDAGLTADTSVVPPIHYSATFRADDAAQFAEMANTPRHPGFYTRYGNPVHKRVEAILAELEGTETALLMASGMGAISTTILALVAGGDHVIAQRRHYMSTSKLFEEVLPRFGVESTIVDQTDLDAMAAAIRPNTRLIMVETPVNPTLSLTDLQAVRSEERRVGKGCRARWSRDHSYEA